MIFNRSEYQIGRGEAAESRIEFPFFVLFMLLSAVVLLGVNTYFRNLPLTIALATSLVIFGLTILRVEMGIFFLVIAMLLSPEIDAGKVGIGNRALNVRYNDILIIIVFIGVLVKCAFEGRQMLWLPSPINSGIFTYYCVCLMSTMLAVRASVPLFDKAEAGFTLLKMAEFYMIFVMVGNAVRDIKQVRAQIILFFMVAAVVCCYGLYTRFFTGMERVSAPFEQGGTEPNTLGGYLTMVMCVAVGLYTQAPKGRAKLWTAAIGLFAFFPFLFTLSRASYIAFLVGILVLGVVTRRAIFVVAIVAALFMSSWLMPKDVRERVNYTFQEGSGQRVVLGGVDTGLEVDKSTYERISVWQKVNFNLHVWPWFGGGVSWDRVLDSQYARVLIETGFLGFIAFAFLQFKLLKSTRESYLWAGHWILRGIAMGTFATTIALIVHSLGTISFLIVRIMEPYWFLVALTAVGRQLAIESYIAKKRQAAVVTEQPKLAQARGARVPA